MRALLRITALALLGIACGAQAQSQHHDSDYRYRWVDAHGLTHYSDTLNVKAVQFGYDVLGVDGRIVRHVTGAPKPGEANAQAHQLSAAEQRQHDRQLLMAYPTAADYQAALQARVDQFDGRISTVRANLLSQEQTLAQLLDNAADYSRNGKTVPAFLKKRLAKQRTAVAAQRQALAQAQAGRTQAQKDAATRLAHYQQLVARQQALYDH
ncbi:MAG TPA: DUF4124 domain-containing protein [Rhodanobacteraceae bacterium]